MPVGWAEGWGIVRKLSEVESKVYADRKERERRRQADQSRSGRDIGPIPEIADSERRAACEYDLRRFLITYFPSAFPRPFSTDHDEFIAETQRAILEGHKKAKAMPRGSGKTTIFERAILWAVIYGHCSMAALIAATDDKAQDNLASIGGELETNDLLAEDFPEVCYPIRKLERIANRAKGQTCQGVPTRIKIVKDRIVIPTIEGSRSSGAAIFAAGLTGGGIRGAKHTMPDGRIVRPSVALIDDPQTRKSASSAADSRTRERIVTGDVTGMAGPGQSLSVLMAVTVIYRGDLADRMLNRTLNPEWRGDRCRLMRSMPANMELWDKYHEIRANDLRADGDGSKGTDFYIANLEAMRAGAEASWEHRKLESDVDAIQHAMNLYYESREAFFAEYQNEPLDESPDGDELLPAPEIMKRLSLVDRRIVPLEAEWITAHIDVHDRLLYFAVCAWSRAFRGFVIDYGAWPDQPMPYFAMRNCRTVLGEKYPGMTREGSISQGLLDLVDLLCGREWTQEGGSVKYLDRLLIDDGYEARKVVFPVARRSEHRRIIRTSKGYAITAKAIRSMDEWPVRDGEIKGDHWRDAPIQSSKVRRITFDPNHWKSFVHKRLAAAEGDPSSLTLFGHDPRRHELLADHLCAEYRVQLSGHRRVDEWQPRPGKPDNHYFDNLVGCAVAASHLGAKLPDTTPAGLPKPRKRKRRRIGITYSGA